MSDAQLRDEAVTLFTAGHETTALTLSYALWCLAERPDLQDALAEERAMVLQGRAPTAADLRALRRHDAVVRESMRLYPPAWMMGRTPMADLDLGDHTVPVGDQILLPQWVVHRDPRWWKQPEAFRPERWLEGETDDLHRFAYFPFGGGPGSASATTSPCSRPSWSSRSGWTSGACAPSPARSST